MPMDERTYPIETVVSMIHEGLYCAEELDPLWAVWRLRERKPTYSGCLDAFLGERLG